MALVRQVEVRFFRKLFECFAASLVGMGKGQHRMPTKDELVQRYNRMNTIPQVMGTFPFLY